VEDIVEDIVEASQRLRQGETGNAICAEKVALVTAACEKWSRHASELARKAKDL